LKDSFIAGVSRDVLFGPALQGKARDTARFVRRAASLLAVAGAGCGGLDKSAAVIGDAEIAGCHVPIKIFKCEIAAPC